MPLTNLRGDKGHSQRRICYIVTWHIPWLWLCYCLNCFSVFCIIIHVCYINFISSNDDRVHIVKMFLVPTYSLCLGTELLYMADSCKGLLGSVIQRWLCTCNSYKEWNLSCQDRYFEILSQWTQNFMKQELAIPDAFRWFINQCQYTCSFLIRIYHVLN